jgi:HNH endonuclease
MAAKPLPSPELLRQLLRYEPKTGKLFWRERSRDMFSDGGRGRHANAKTWNCQHAYKEAFTSKMNTGYHQGHVIDQMYLAHRVIWAIFFGYWPTNQIDHIDGNRANNAISNLRIVNAAENKRNARMTITNKTGVIGVTYRKEKDRYQAQIKVGRKSIHLGTFKDLASAAKARKIAERHYGFHVNHGDRYITCQLSKSQSDGWGK